MAIDTHQCLDDKGGEAQVLLSCLAGGMQQHAVVSAQRPVVVLAAAVDACEGLFVEQYTEAVLAGHALHHRHEQHVVVYGQVGFLEYRGQFKLVGSDLVVARLTGDAQFESHDFQLAHEGSHALGYGSEVVVIHLLVLGRVVAHQRASCQQQVGTSRVEAFVYQEVLLLPTEVRGHLFYSRVEVVAHVRSGHVDGMESTQQRSLVVECFARV